MTTHAQCLQSEVHFQQQSIGAALSSMPTYQPTPRNTDTDAVHRACAYLVHGEPIGHRRQLHFLLIKGGGCRQSTAIPRPATAKVKSSQHGLGASGENLTDGTES
jgi:hypothetical protein